MALFFNRLDIRQNDYNVFFNGVEVKEVFLDGVSVWKVNPPFGGEMITTSGTYTVPEGVHKIKVQMIGGGGSGAGVQAGKSAGGGMAGEYKEFTKYVCAGDFMDVTIGAGGARVVSCCHPGNNGGNTTFGRVTALGGQGGTKDEPITNYRGEGASHTYDGVVLYDGKKHPAGNAYGGQSSRFGSGGSGNWGHPSSFGGFGAGSGGVVGAFQGGEATGLGGQGLVVISYLDKYS